MAGTLRGHAKGILSQYRTGLTGGTAEGITRRIGRLFAADSGMRDNEFLKLRPSALHEAGWSCVG